MTPTRLTAFDIDLMAVGAPSRRSGPWDHAPATGRRRFRLTLASSLRRAADRLAGPGYRN